MGFSGSAACRQRVLLGWIRAPVWMQGHGRYVLNDSVRVGSLAAQWHPRP